MFATFDRIRDLASRYRTELLPAALRLVACSGEDAMLVSSRPSQSSRCLRRNDVALDFWLRKEPGPATAAHGLPRGSRQSPGSTEVLLDAWIDHRQWWLTVQEDSVAMPGGEDLSLLWWTGTGTTRWWSWARDSRWRPSRARRR